MLNNIRMFDAAEKLAFFFKFPGEMIHWVLIVLEQSVMEKFGSTGKLTTFSSADFTIRANTKNFFRVNLHRVMAQLFREWKHDFINYFDFLGCIYQHLVYI